MPGRLWQSLSHLPNISRSNSSIKLQLFEFSKKDDNAKSAIEVATSSTTVSQYKSEKWFDKSPKVSIDEGLSRKFNDIRRT